MPSKNSYASLTHATPSSALGLPRAGPSTFRAASKSSVEPDEVDFDDIESPPRTGVLGKAREIIFNNTGLLLGIASQLFLAMMNTSVKKLNSIDPSVSALELIVVRMSITYIASIAYMFATNIPDPFLGPKGVRLLLVFRGFLGFFGLFGVYYSLEYLSLSDAIVLTFLAPMCTALAGALFLKETFTFKEAIAGMCSLFGVILIARPVFIFGKTALNDISEKGTPEQRLIAVAVALFGVLGGTGSFITIRAIGDRAHAFHSILFFSSQCVIVGIAGIFVTRTPIVIPTQLDWFFMVIMIGIPGLIGQILQTMSFQRESAGRSSMAIYTQIVFATILERVVFHTSPSALSVLGTLIILAAALYIVLTKNSEHKTKQTSNTVRLSRLSHEGLEEGLLARPQLEDIQEDNEDKYHIKTAGEELHAKAGLKDGEGG